MNKQAKINPLKSETDGPKILVINPNSTSTMTDKIAKFVESHKASGTFVETVCLLYTSPSPRD